MPRQWPLALDPHALPSAQPDQASLEVGHHRQHAEQQAADRVGGIADRSVPAQADPAGARPRSPARQAATAPAGRPSWSACPLRSDNSRRDGRSLSRNHFSRAARPAQVTPARRGDADLASRYSRATLRTSPKLPGCTSGVETGRALHAAYGLCAETTGQVERCRPPRPSGRPRRAPAFSAPMSTQAHPRAVPKSNPAEGTGYGTGPGGLRGKRGSGRAAPIPLRRGELASHPPTRRGPEARAVRRLCVVFGSMRPCVSVLRGADQENLVDGRSCSSPSRKMSTFSL